MTRKLYIVAGAAIILILNALLLMFILVSEIIHNWRRVGER